MAKETEKEGTGREFGESLGTSGCGDVRADLRSLLDPQGRRGHLTLPQGLRQNTATQRNIENFSLHKVQKKPTEP
ncbi:hypothetical protein E2C01_068110 [Portunus trituberculatus]|uniref:Uncharacterized protein n=1 Tax=Portunus trituberculatus TaxID=210409 RepID=A0A5B7HUX5_PORTR|nr:hypothetical protein [Portunus trituberculatus]